ncbi:hypothetical protein ACWCQK_02600 [Streptomyces sp. NPDC002306]
MRRTARLLSVVALAGAGLAHGAPTALADPVAQVSPGSPAPGSSVTVSVTCTVPAGSPPGTIDATSPAFDQGTVELTRVTTADAGSSGTTYRGTARITAVQETKDPQDTASAGTLGTLGATGSVSAADSASTVGGTCPAAAGEQGEAWNAKFTVDRAADSGTCAAQDGTSACASSGVSVTTGAVPGQDSGVTVTASAVPSQDSGSAKDAGTGTGTDTGTGTGVSGGATAGADAGATVGDSGGDTGKQNTVDGVKESEGSGTDTDTDTDEDGGRSCADPRADGRPGTCDGAGAKHGVEAGQGGSLTGSLPALVAGGLFVAGAFGAAAHRLWRREPTREN